MDRLETFSAFLNVPRANFSCNLHSARTRPPRCVGAIIERKLGLAILLRAPNMPTTITSFACVDATMA